MKEEALLKMSSDIDKVWSELTFTYLFPSINNSNQPFSGQANDKISIKKEAFERAQREFEEFKQFDALDDQIRQAKAKSFWYQVRCS